MTAFATAAAALQESLSGEPACPATSENIVRVALAGYGVVGQALAERIAHSHSFALAPILVRDTNKVRAVTPPGELVSDRRALLADKPDILVDALSCAETGALLCEWALAQGIHVVSASKRVIAGAYPALDRCAKVSGARFLYSAAVGGETPVLEAIAAAAAEQEIVSVTGVLNGTVNFILDRLSRGLSFAEALQQAQIAGFAEEDPSEDVSGADAAAKLRIVAAASFGGSPTDYAFKFEALDSAALARIEGQGRFVQLATVERRDGIVTGSVRLVPREEAGALPIGDGEWNCARIEATDGFSRVVTGRGAGGAPTAGALLSDLVRLTREVGLGG